MATMATVPSQSHPQEVGGSSGGPLISSLATKRKGPPVMNQKRYPAAKQHKNQQKSLTSSPMKRPAETSKGPPMARKKQRSPLVKSPPIVTGAPMMTGSTSAEKKPRRLRSEIWNDMEPIYHDGKLIQARCKHCNEVFSAARNSGTSHMRRHLGVCEPRFKMHDMVEKLQSSETMHDMVAKLQSSETTVPTNWKFDRTIAQCELVRLIVLHELPFSLVEYDGFRSYSLSLNPLAESVSSTTIEETCMEAYKNQKSSLRDLFGDCNCRFSLTADLWTSNQTTGYIVITCHYIDGDWKVQKKIIRFCEVKTPLDGFNLYSVMLQTIHHYNIQDKLFSITLDNASENESVMDLLQVNLSTKSMLHCDGDLFYVRCAAHFLNLIVEDALQAIDGVINDVRESVKYINGSQSRKEKFEEIIGDIGIDCGTRPSLDVPTRWNSTCDMLESAFPFKVAFLELANQDPNYMHSPTPEEWQRADVVCTLLKVFKKATEVVSGSRYPTSNLYFHEIWSVKQALESEASSRNPIIASMVLEMGTKFDKYWNISYLSNCIPVVLDPRFKFGFIEFRLKQAFGDTAGIHIAKVDKSIRSLFDGYASEMRDSFNCSTQGNVNATSVKGHSWSDWSNHISARSNLVVGELDRYLRDDLLPCEDDSFDILHWWKMHASKYPVVARMARDVLAAPASTVSSESTFSMGGRIINDHRTKLSGNTVEALICLQDWVREAGSSYLDIIKINRAIEGSGAADR